MTLPLEGLKVLDLSRLLPGGFCSLMLADFGADVIKVEDTGLGDYVRWSPPYYEGAEASARGALFLALNRGKRSIRIDLKTAPGREVLLRLAADADVLLESFRPGVLGRLGVGYERLREVNSRLVYCAITGYGQNGRDRDRPGRGELVEARLGLQYEQPGYRDGPIYLGWPLAEYGGAFLTAIGLVAALYVRAGLGKGQLVDTSSARIATGAIDPRYCSLRSLEDITWRDQVRTVLFATGRLVGVLQGFRLWGE